MRPHSWDSRQGVATRCRITHNYRSPLAAPGIERFVEHFWTGSRVEPDRAVGVVVDGHVITALPNAAIEFATAVCVELGVYSAAEASLMVRHLRGEYVDELIRGMRPRWRTRDDQRES